MTTEQRFRRLLSLLLPVAGWRLPVAFLHGPDRAAGRQVSLLTAGAPGITGYVASRFFAEEPQSEYLGLVSAWRLERFLNQRAPRADLTVAGMDRHSARLWMGRSFLRCPAWVGSGMPVPADTAAVMKSSTQLWRDLHYIRADPFDSTPSTDSADLDLFYERYYQPFILSRHGALAHIRSRWDMRRRFRRGCILWLSRGGTRIAGSLVSRLGDTLDLIALGVLDGDADRCRRGTMTALYFHEIEHARRTGCKRLFLGGSRPSLHDDVFRTKRRWGAAVGLHPEVNFDMLVRWNTLTGPVADFLTHNSLIYHDSGGLSALWHAPDGPPDAAHLKKEVARLWTPGLRRLNVLRAPAAAATCPPLPDVRWITLESLAQTSPEGLLLQG